MKSSSKLDMLPSTETMCFEKHMGEVLVFTRFQEHTLHKHQQQLQFGSLLGVIPNGKNNRDEGQTFPRRLKQFQSKQ